jgi:predicted permease
MTALLAALDDFRFALRSLNKSPGFTLVAILTLALGIGANSAVFSLISAVLFKPLPYAEPDRLVLVWESAPFFGLRDSPVSPANYVDWRARSRSFEEMGALETHSFRLLGEGTPEVVEGSLVSASLLRALRTQPALGRVFREEEDRPGAAKVAIVSDSFWRRKLNADRSAVGRTLTLNDEKHTIVGVLAPGTEPPAEYSDELSEILAPFGSAYTAKELANRGRHNWMVIARLRPAVRLAEADAEMRAIGGSLAREYPETNEKVGAFVTPLRDHFVASGRRMLLILAGAVGFVLLIACSNLANLLLCRAANRSKEVAVRAALGAGWRQLVRPFLSESLLLCAAGSGLGLLLASSTFPFLAHLAPGAVSGMKALDIDGRVLVFTIAIATLTAVVFGLVPLIQFRRLDISNALKQNARTLAAASGSSGLRAALICGEVALAFVLLISAGLLIQTFMRLRGVDLGCRTENILTLKMPASAAHRGPDKSPAFQREVLRRVREVPGVLSAGFINHIPLLEKGDISGIGAEGHDESERFQCNSRIAGPGYFTTMGIPLLRGRYIEERDQEGAPYVAVINATLARMLWPGQDPIGRKLHFGTEYKVPVVGVVGDVHQSGLDIPPKPEFYVSSLQGAGWPPSSLAIQTRGDPASAASAVRQAIWRVDPDQPITRLATMEEILDGEVFQRRLQMTLLAVFAGLALLLAAIGLYGVLAYLVGQQTPEIGVRMALGAAPWDIVRRVVGQGLRLTGIGLVTGLAGALAATRALGSVLFGVKPADPLTYSAVAAVLLLTAALASYLPARRGMRVDPMVALRQE